MLGHYPTPYLPSARVCYFLSLSSKREIMPIIRLRLDFDSDKHTFFLNWGTFVRLEQHVPTDLTVSLERKGRRRGRMCCEK